LEMTLFCEEKGRLPAGKNTSWPQIFVDSATACAVWDDARGCWDSEGDGREEDGELWNILYCTTASLTHCSSPSLTHCSTSSLLL
jgi:hypothetical protein